MLLHPIELVIDVFLQAHRIHRSLFRFINLFQKLVIQTHYFHLVLFLDFQVLSIQNIVIQFLNAHQKLQRSIQITIEVVVFQPNDYILYSKLSDLIIHSRTILVLVLTDYFIILFQINYRNILSLFNCLIIIIIIDFSILVLMLTFYQSRLLHIFLTINQTFLTIELQIDITVLHFLILFLLDRFRLFQILELIIKFGPTTIAAIIIDAATTVLVNLQTLVALLISINRTMFSAIIRSIATLFTIFLIIMTNTLLLPDLILLIRLDIRNHQVYPTFILDIYHLVFDDRWASSVHLLDEHPAFCRNINIIHIFLQTIYEFASLTILQNMVIDLSEAFLVFLPS